MWKYYNLQCFSIPIFNVAFEIQKRGPELAHCVETLSLLCAEYIVYVRAKTALLASPPLSLSSNVAMTAVNCCPFKGGVIEEERVRLTRFKAKCSSPLHTFPVSFKHYSCENLMSILPISSQFPLVRRSSLSFRKLSLSWFFKWHFTLSFRPLLNYVKCQNQSRLNFVSSFELLFPSWRGNVWYNQRLSVYREHEQWERKWFE